MHNYTSACMRFESSIDTGIQQFLRPALCIHGQIKAHPEDFIVSEITPAGSVCSLPAFDLVSNNVPDVPLEQNEIEKNNPRQDRIDDEDCIALITRYLGKDLYHGLRSFAHTVAPNLNELASLPAPCAETLTERELPITLPQALQDNKELRGQIRRAITFLYPHISTTLVRANGCKPELRCSCNRPLMQLSPYIDSEDLFRVMKYVANGDAVPTAREGVTVHLPAGKVERTQFFNIFRTSLTFLNAFHSTSRQNIAKINGKRNRDVGSSTPTDCPPRMKATIIFKRAMHSSSGIKRSKRQQWWLHFVLLKRDKEHTEILRWLAKECGVPEGFLRCAGIKDKRAITTQQICIKGIRAETLIKAVANFVGRNRNTISNSQNASVDVRVGCFRYETNPLKIGDLSGNVFKLIVRESGTSFVSNKTLSQRNAMSQSTFFGGQPQSKGSVTFPSSVSRTSSCEAVQTLSALDSAEVLRRIEGMMDGGFINYFGHQRVGKGFSMEGYGSPDFGASLFRQNYAELIDRLLCCRPTGPADEHAARQAWVSTRNIKETLKLMPSRCSILCSLLQKLKRTSSVSSSTHVMRPLRHSERACQIAIESLPFQTCSIWLHAYQSLVWNRAVTFRISKYGYTTQPGDLVLIDATEGKPLDAWEKPHMTHTKKKWDVHIVTQEDVIKKIYDFHHIVLPLPSSRVMYPKNEVRTFYQELLVHDRTAEILWNESADMQDVHHEVLASATDSSDNKLKLPSWIARVRGGYRHIAVIPRKFEAYMVANQLDHSEQQTDCMKQLHVSFALPPSSYATMCLREFMHDSGSVILQHE